MADLFDRDVKTLIVLSCSFFDKLWEANKFKMEFFIKQMGVCGIDRNSDSV